MADVNAADLPDGSVVGFEKVVYLKSCRDSDLPWQYYGDSMFTNYAGNDEVQEKLADGAAVLREGY